MSEEIMYVSEDGTVILGKNRNNTEEKVKRRRLSDLNSFSREDNIVKKMAGIIMNIPDILGFFLNEDEIVIDLPRDIANKIKSGEYTFFNTKEGSIKAQIRDVKTGYIVRNLDLKEASKVSELSNLAATATLYAQLKTIESKIDKVNEGIETLAKCLENDRLVRVISVRESLHQALSIREDSIRKQLMVSTLSESLVAKNMFYK